MLCSSVNISKKLEVIYCIHPTHKDRQGFKPDLQILNPDPLHTEASVVCTIVTFVTNTKPTWSGRYGLNRDVMS